MPSQATVPMSPATPMMTLKPFRTTKTGEDVFRFFMSGTGHVECLRNANTCLKIFVQQHNKIFIFFINNIENIIYVKTSKKK